MLEYGKRYDVANGLVTSVMEPSGIPCYPFKATVGGRVCTWNADGEMFERRRHPHALDCVREHGAPVSRNERERQFLAAGIMAAQRLIEESTGVTGLHLNGDVAPWADLRTGGRFASWLIEFDEALKLAEAITQTDPESIL